MNRQPYAASDRKPTKTALPLDAAYVAPEGPVWDRSKRQDPVAGDCLSDMGPARGCGGAGRRRTPFPFELDWKTCTGPPAHHVHKPQSPLPSPSPGSWLPTSGFRFNFPVSALKHYPRSRNILEQTQGILVAEEGLERYQT